ncbi:MAG TPA: 4Fe-4S binding protein [Tissierellaceae bacterium]
MKISSIFFSGSGNTKKIAYYSRTYVNKILKNSVIKKDIDLTLSPINSEHLYSKDDLLIISFPVYSGRVPKYIINSIENIKGNNTPCIILQTYGNRDFDDSLIEMKTFLENKSFIILGCCSIVSRHSIFPEVAKDRPNEKDLDILKEFLRLSTKKLSNKDFNNFSVPGNKKYKEYKKSTLYPIANSNCTLCNKCIIFCPVHAISITDPLVVDENKCIACGKCINVCSFNARGYFTEEYKVLNENFIKNNSKPKKSSYYL